LALLPQTLRVILTMKRINYALNGYYKTASIIIEYGNPFVFMIDKVTEFVCAYLIPPLPFPSFNIVKDGETYTLKEYYGNLESVFCIFVHHPISDWCNRRIKIHMVDVDYYKLREGCYERDKKFWTEVESLWEDE